MSLLDHPEALSGLGIVGCMAATAVITFRHMEGTSNARAHGLLMLLSTLPWWLFAFFHGGVVFGALACTALGCCLWVQKPKDNCVDPRGFKALRSWALVWVVSAIYPLWFFGSLAWGLRNSQPF